MPMKLPKTIALVIAMSCTCSFAQTVPDVVLIVNTFPKTSPGLQPNLDFDALLAGMNGPTPRLGVAIKPIDPLPPSFAFEQVSRGRLQMMWANSANFSEKNFGFVLFGQPPFIAADKYFEWRAKPDTAKMADDLYARYGLKAVPCAAVDSNMDFVLRMVPQGDYQFRGARVAMNGPHRDLYAATGVMSIGIPFGEMRDALQAGTIDGAYAWTPHESVDMKLWESAKVVYFPSEIRHFFAIDLFLNLQFWKDLPDKSRTAIEETCAGLVKESLISSRKNAAAAIERYQAASVAVLPMPRKEVEVMRASWRHNASKQSLFDPAFGSMYRSLYAQ